MMTCDDLLAMARKNHLPASYPPLPATRSRRGAPRVWRLLSARLDPPAIVRLRHSDLPGPVSERGALALQASDDGVDHRRASSIYATVIRFFTEPDVDASIGARMGASGTPLLAVLSRISTPGT